MKKFLTVLFLLVPAIAFCGEGPVISFQKEAIDFGHVKKRAKLKAVFEFTNTGTETLVISNVASG